MKKPLIGIIIVTFNSAEFIKKCILSIRQSKYPNFKILVVDNASSDNTLSIIRHNFPEVVVIPSKKNLGFGAGNNLGIKYLQKLNCAYFTLINPDTIINPTLIQKVVDVFTLDKTIGVAGPLITYMNEQQKIWFAGGYFNRNFCFTKHPYMNKNLKDTSIISRKVDFITGACMMVRADVFNKVGLLPEEYFLYFEDVFFCQKVIHAGYSCYFLAEDLVAHNVSSSTGSAGTNIMTPLRAYYFARNPLIYIKNEVYGFQRASNYVGQFFIRFPYYCTQIIQHKNFKSFFYYLKGIKDGLLVKSNDIIISN